MKYLNKIPAGIVASVFAVGALFSACDDDDLYSVDAPDWVSAAIDSIAATRVSVTNGDTTELVLNVTEVGTSDCSAAWWTYFSDSFEIPAGKKLTLEFENYTSGSNNWNNWNLALVNVDGSHSTTDDSSYKEYFVLRSDAYGWGGDMASENADYTYDSGYITYDYPDTDGNGDVWNDFLSYMQGAYVTLQIDHSTTGYAFVTAQAVATDGTVLTETFQNGVSPSANIYAFLVVDGSYLVMKRAYLTPSDVTEVEDQDPTSLAVTGTPTSIEAGSEDYIGSAVFTVTYADGSSEEVSSENITFTVPDLTTAGEKVIIATYGLTKEGAATSSPVSTYYTITVTDAITAISVKTSPTITTYYYYGTTIPQFDSTGLEITATYDDGTTGDLDVSTLTFSSLTATSTSVTASYTSDITCNIDVTMVEGIEAIGSMDYTNGWWSTFMASDVQVTTDKSVSIPMYVYSDNLGNWHSPCVILRKADATEYTVVRMDNYGWGSSYALTDENDAVIEQYAVLESDWDWDVFMSSICYSHVTVTVSIDSDGYATIRYDVTYANGDTHYQQYSNLSVDPDDCYVGLVTEESCLILLSE